MHDSMYIHSIPGSHQQKNAMFYAKQAQARHNALNSGLAPEDQTVAVNSIGIKTYRDYKNDEAVTKTIRFDWSGTAEEFACDEAKRTSKLILTDKNKAMHENDRLILFSTEIQTVQNTGPIAVAVNIKGTPIESGFIDGSGKERDIVIEARTISPVFVGQLLYRHPKSDKINKDMVRHWENITPGLIDATILEKNNDVWTLEIGSPIIRVAFAICDSVNDHTLAQFNEKAFLNTTIAQGAYDYIIGVIEQLPFQKLEKISATISRADGKSFDSTENLGDSTAMSDVNVDHALKSRMTVTLTAKQTYVVWKKANVIK